jgi:uncharacterized delta-60 repeat protein
VGSHEGDLLNERTKNSTFWRPLVGLLLFVGLAGFAEASGGVVITDIIGLDYAVVIDSFGRIVMAGSTQSPATGFDALLLARYNPDGSPDTSFGNGRVVITDVTGANVGARAMAMDGLGRIVVAGNSTQRGTLPNYGFLVARYNSDGSLDTSFGNGGLVITHISTHDWLNAMAIDSLGRIVVAGYIQTFASPVTHPSIALARYNSDGSLDATFGNGGIVTTDIDGRRSGAGGVAIDDVGRIIVAGSSNGGFTLARYNSDGSLDNTFGNANGIVLVAHIGDSGCCTSASTVAVDGLGRIVAAGANETFVGAEHYSFALVRSNSDGTLDASFGNGGVVTTHVRGTGTGDDSVAGMVSDSLGRIVAVGVCPWDCGISDFELARYNSDGSLDATFGNGGLVITQVQVGPTGGSNDSSQAVSIDGLGRIVVAGWSDAGDPHLALARYNPDGSLDNTFGEPGPVVTGLQFDRSSVAPGSSYSANFSGVHLTDGTFFDVRYSAPGSNDSGVVLNWQIGIAASHSVPAGITSGIWTINGVRAHQIGTDQSGNFAPVSAMITVSP